MDIKKIDSFFQSFTSSSSVQNQKIEERKNFSDDAAKVSVSFAEQEEAAKAEKVKALKARYEAGTLSYDSKDVAVALVRDLGI